MRIPLIGRLPIHQRVCQDNSTEEPEDPNDLESGRARIFSHGTPLFPVPSILLSGLRASVRSHNYVGLWCRDNVEKAHGARALRCSIAAWSEPPGHRADQGHGKILHNSYFESGKCAVRPGRTWQRLLLRWSGSPPKRRHGRHASGRITAGRPGLLVRGHGQIVGFPSPSCEIC